MTCIFVVKPWMVDRRTLLALAIFTATIVFALPDGAFACRCARLAAEDHLVGVQMVFSGEILTVDEISETVGSRTHVVGEVALARVDWVWKGEVGPMVEFRYPTDGATCGISLTEGYYEVIMLYSVGSRLTTDQCTQSPHITVDAVFRVLGAGSRPSPFQ